MKISLGIKENSIDSFNEALEKFQAGEQGSHTAYKFAILNMAQFIELMLKQYLIGINEHLVFSKCFNEVKKRAKATGVDLLAAYQTMHEEGFDLGQLICSNSKPHTVRVDEALAFASLEICEKTGVNFVDQSFIDDINWMKDLRNDIEHFQFHMDAKEVRLCLGRLVRSALEFLEIFSIMDLSKEVGKGQLHIFELLASEYQQFLREAKRDVATAEKNAFRGLRPKEREFANWAVYRCEECGEDTMIPNDDSSTGFRCSFPGCENEESDEIEVDCDVCGCPCPNGLMSYWGEDLPNVCVSCSERHE